MVPGGVISHILFQEFRNILEFPLIPQTEALNKPLPVRPDVIVLGVLLKHARDELSLARWITKSIDDQLPMVPYLVVFLVSECLLIQKRDFRMQINLEGEDDFGAVEPTNSKQDGNSSGLDTGIHQTV